MHVRFERSKFFRSIDRGTLEHVHATYVSRYLACTRIYCIRSDAFTRRAYRRNPCVSMRSFRACTCVFKQFMFDWVLSIRTDRELLQSYSTQKTYASLLKQWKSQDIWHYATLFTILFLFAEHCCSNSFDLIRKCCYSLYCLSSDLIFQCD